MPEKFDPYQHWLGIPPEDQPPNHYQMLGLRLFEDDPAVIESAADERRGILHPYQKGENGQVCVKLMNEISSAKACLINLNRKAAYDRGLRQSLEAEQEVQAISAERFLTLLQQKDLLPTSLLATLRRQVSQPGKSIAASAVANKLVGAGHLTPALAQRLLSTPAEQAKPFDKPQKTKKPAKPVPVEPEEEIGLAPLDDDDPVAARKKHREEAAKKRAKEREVTKQPPAAEVPVAETAVPVEKPKVPEPPQQETPILLTPVAQPQKPATLMEEELQPAAEATSGKATLDEMLDDSDLSSGPLTQTKRRQGLRGLFSRGKRGGHRENVWDSPLLLIVGGVLLVLMIVGPILYWAIMRRGGDEVLAAANKLYEKLRYPEAIQAYDDYLDEHSSHVGVSSARVRRGLAQIRLVADRRKTKDWRKALSEAKRVLAEIENEAKFPDARPELATLLPMIAKGLATQAYADSDLKLVALAKEALDLSTKSKYVLPTARPEQQLRDIQAMLARTEHNAARERELTATIAEMRRAIEQGDTRAAYQKRKNLLGEYPTLADLSALEKGSEEYKQAEQLHEAVLEVSEAQLAAVKVIDVPTPSERAPAEPAKTPTTTLAVRTLSAEAPGVQGQTVFARAAGAVYGLDAATGKVLWRRMLGFASNGKNLGFPPTPLRSNPGADVLVVAPDDNSESGRDADVLLALAATTGEVRWRHPVGDRVDAHPIVLDGEILVAVRDGRLLTIDPKTGDSSGHTWVPQSLQVAPAVRRGLVFQVADHSNLFVLSAQDGTCRQVLYLGHAAGSISVPPVTVSGFLVISENDRLRGSRLRVLAISEENEKAVELRQEIRLTGRVDVAPVVDGDRMLVTTDRGRVHVFAITDSDSDTPLTPVASTNVDTAEQTARFALMREGDVWLADTQLTKYGIVASQSELNAEWINTPDSAFLQPPVAIGQVLFHVRRKVGVPGVVVAASAADKKETFWETHLAAPLATEPIVDPAGKVTLVTKAGGLFQADAAALAGTSIAQQPVAVADPVRLAPSVSDTISLGAGRVALSAGAGSKQIALIDLADQAKRFRWINLPDALACSPIAVDGGLLAPTQPGYVYLIDPTTLQKRAEPFQPTLQGTVQPGWRLPAVARPQQQPLGPATVVLADGHSHLYHLAIQGQPQPRLEAIQTAQTSANVVSPVAVIGDAVYAVDEAGVLTAYSLSNELSPLHQQGLSGRCVWGPQRVGSHVMLTTDDGKLLCLGSDGKPVWPQAGSLPYGPLAGSPFASGSSFILASTGGTIWSIDVTTGKELGRVASGYPLATGPVPLGGKLLVGGHDGSVYLLQSPQGPEDANE